MYVCTVLRNVNVDSDSIHGNSLRVLRTRTFSSFSMHNTLHESTYVRRRAYKAKFSSLTFISRSAAICTICCTVSIPTSLQAPTPRTQRSSPNRGQSDTPGANPRRVERIVHVRVFISGAVWSTFDAHKYTCMCAQTRVFCPSYTCIHSSLPLSVFHFLSYNTQ